MIFGNIKDIVDLNTKLNDELKEIWNNRESVIEIQKVSMEFVDEDWIDYTFKVAMAFDGSKAENYQAIEVTVPERLTALPGDSMAWYILGAAVEKYEAKEATL